MQKKPKQPTGCDRNNGGAHLRPEHLASLVAAHPRKSERSAGPKDAGQYMQHLGDDEGDLHDEAPYTAKFDNLDIHDVYPIWDVK
jgi:hypothetical protein